MSARLASLAVFVLALPAAAEPNRFVVEGRLLLPAGFRAGEALEIVAWRASDGSGLHGAALGSAHPDAEGRFRLALELEERGFALGIQSRWLEQWPLWIEPRAGERSLEVRLAPRLRGVLRGRFVAPDERPFERAALAGSWLWIEGSPRCVTTSDSAGEFELAGPARSLDGALFACPRGFAPLVLERPLLEDGRELELALPLIEAAHVRGRLVDSAGRGIGGVTLSVARGRGPGMELPLDPWSESRTVTSARDGAFELGELPPGDLRLAPLDPRWRARAARIEGLRAGEERNGIELVLVRGAALAGTLVDEDGYALPGARVTAGPRSGEGALLVATSDADGQYRFDSLPPGDYVLCASLDDRAARSGRVLALGEGEHEQADLVLARGTHLVIDVRELPAPVQVHVEDAAGFLRAEQRVWSGELELVLAPGIYRVAITTRAGLRLERRVVLTGREADALHVRM